MVQESFWLRRGVRRQLNDKGSAMVMVVVVIMFLSILATTLLYISSMNYQIKQTDYKNKKSFYNGETYMETVRAELMKDVSTAAAIAYNDTMTNYMSLSTKDMRTAEYNKRFGEELDNIWNGRGDWKVWLNGTTFIPSGSTGIKFDLVGADLDASNSTTTYASDIVDDTNRANGYYFIKRIQLEYRDAAGYKSQITTNFYVQAPEFNWAEDASSTGAPAVGEAIKAETINLADCVKYVNWEKQ